MIYLDSSAIIKLVFAEPESAALRTYLRRRSPLVSSALARTEVSRTSLPAGPRAAARAATVLGRLTLLRVSDRVLTAAGHVLPAEMRSLDAIHLASAALFGAELRTVCTYDERMADAATFMGWRVAAPH